MMRIFKAIITPLVLLSIIFSPVFTQKAQAICVFGVGNTCDEKESGKEAEKELNEKLKGNFNDLAVKSCPIKWSELEIGGLLGSAGGLLTANIAISLLNGLPYVGGAAEPFDDALDQLNSAWLSALTWGFVASLATYISAYLIQVGFALNSNVTTNNPVIQTGFNVTLGIVNIAFVILLVVIGIMTILRRSGWAAQKRLGNLIVAVILINFSIYFANLLLGISNVFTGALLGNACAGELFNKLNLVNIFNIIQPVIGGSKLNPLTSTAALVIAALFTIISALTLFAIFLFLVIRYVAIVILLVFMPIAWLGFVAPEIKIPGLGNPWTKWWEEFMRWITVGPLMSFSLYLTISILQNMGKVVDTSLNPPQSAFIQTTVAANAPSPLLGILNIFAALIMSLLGIFIAIKGSGVAGALIAGGLATGTAFAAKGLQSVGGRFGFGGQLKLEDRAKKLREEAEKAEEKGDIGKAQSLRRRAMAAEKFAAGAGALGKGAAVTPTGLGFGLGGKLLEQAGVKGIKPSGEITSAQAWREAAVKKASARYAGMSEDERKREIREVTGELSKGALPGRKIELYNRYAALAQTMAKDGKLSDEMLNTVMREDFQKQSSLMGVSVDISETFKKLPADQLAKKISTLNILKTKEGIDKKAIEKVQVEAIRQLQSKKKLGEITDPNSVRTVYSLKEQIEKKDGAGSFKNYELAFGVNKESADVFYEATDKIINSNNKTSEINTRLTELTSQGSLTTSPEYIQLQNELNKIAAERQQAEQRIGDQTKELSKWMAGLKTDEVKKLPLDKIFGDPNNAGNQLFAGADPQNMINLRTNLSETIAKEAPHAAAQFLNVSSANYETAAKAIHSAIGRQRSDPSLNPAQQQSLDTAAKSVYNAAKKRGVQL